jgi:hypothetical protein
MILLPCLIIGGFMKNNDLLSLRKSLLLVLVFAFNLLAFNSYAVNSPSASAEDLRPGPIERQLKIFKYAQSTQCNNDGIPLKKMAEELKAAGITFTCAQRANDGMAYPAVCGGATGDINVFQIYSSDLPLARRLGYAPVSTLPEYQDRPCGEAKVFKYDGSTQCNNDGIPLKKMAQELTAGGIDVICAQKASDGMMYPAVCGGGTGAINVYLIHKENVQDAEALGFASVNELPQYQDTPCR